MGFWDIIEDPYDWLKSKGTRTQIAGTPHATRKGLNRRGGNPLDIINGTLGESLPGSGGNRVYGHFNDEGMGPYRRQQSRTVRSGAQSLLDRLNAPPTTADILAQLQALQDPSRYESDQGSLARQAMEMASAQYDPEIAQLESLINGAQGRASRNKVILGDLYGDLSNSIQQDIPAIEQQYTGDKAESQAGFDKLQQQTKDTYAQTAADQQQMMQQLNIQAAAPEVLSQQNRDRDYFTSLAAQNAQTEQTALGKEERGAVNYTRQGSELARLEGSNRQADLMAQLEDLVSQYSSQIGAEKSAKNQSYLATLGQLSSDSQNSAMQRAQRDFENYIATIQLGRSLDKDKGASNVSAVKSPADVAGRALTLGLDQRSAQGVQDVFMSTISSDPQIMSGTGVFGTSAPKEAMAQRVVEAGRKSGLNRQQLNALQTIALEYFGRR